MEQVSTFKNYVLCLFRYRGKLISFNEFQTNNTRIELIDYGSVYHTKLENLFILPYYFEYGPLVSKSYLNCKHLNLIHFMYNNYYILGFTSQIQRFYSEENNIFYKTSSVRKCNYCVITYNF